MDGLEQTNCWILTRFLNLYNRICKNCGEEFVTRDRRKIFCNKKECKNAAARIWYAKKLKRCVCKFCGTEYNATGKQLKDCCPDCKKLRERPKRETHEVRCLCKYCGQYIKSYYRENSGNMVHEDFTYVCDSCKEKSRERMSKNMKLNNPTYEHSLTEEEYEIKQENIRKEAAYREEHSDELRNAFLKRASERMKSNNPMRNPETANKVRETLKKKVADGEITYPRGKDSPIYKGSRSIKGYLRIAIIPWRNANFTRAKYTCEICGKTGCTLHVHHKEPFNDIFYKFVDYFHLDESSIEYMSDDYIKLENAIVEYHNSHDIGIVVCEDCHSDIDKHYHKRHRKRDENENQEHS